MPTSANFSDLIMRGTHADRPAAGAAGRLYYETDTTTLFRDNGASWDNAEGAGTLGGSTGGTDNAIIRANGTGGATVQNSPATIDDSGTLNIPTGQTYNINNTPHTHAGGFSGAADDLTTAETDTAKVLTPDGAGGVQWSTGAGGGGAGLVELVFDSTLGSDAANFDITSIPGAYALLMIYLTGRSTRAGQTNDSVSLRFNNDSGANQYDWEWWQVPGGTDGSAVAQIRIGYTTAASSTSGDASQHVLEIHGYADTTFNKNVTCRDASPRQRSSGQLHMDVAIGHWRSNAAITRATIYPDNGNWLAGSRCTAWGYKVA